MKEEKELPGMPQRDRVGEAAISYLTAKDRAAEAKAACDEEAEQCAAEMLAANRSEIRVGARVVKVKYVEAAATVSVVKAPTGRVGLGVQDD